MTTSPAIRAPTPRKLKAECAHVPSRFCFCVVVGCTMRIASIKRRMPADCNNCIDQNRTSDAGIMTYRMVTEEDDLVLEYGRLVDGQCVLNQLFRYLCRYSRTQTRAAKIQTPTCARTPVPFHRLKASQCSGFCVASPGLPSNGSSSELVGACCGMPVAEAMPVECAICGSSVVLALAV